MKNKNTSAFLAGVLIASSTLQSTSLIYANPVENTNNVYQDYINNEVNQPIDGEKYETYTMPITKNLDKPDMTSHELSDAQGLSYIKRFKLKTNDSYEIALSKGNGEYTYLDSSNILDEAMEIANNSKYAYKNAIPVVISNKGLVVYATEGIAKIVKTKDGQVVSQNTTINLYKDPEGKKTHTYISPGAVDDAPVVDVVENMAKIEVAGFNGWMPISDSKGDNLIMVPLNDAKNLSYYQVNSNNELIHKVSTAVEIEGKNESIIIGHAPSFMQASKKYYSYDGMYFYEDINKLISDLKNSNHYNAVNRNDPYYNYYNTLPGRTKTVYTASELNSYIDKNAPSGSVLRGTGESFIKYQNEYGVNALMALSISINESGFGTKLVKPNNIFGIKANDGAESGATEFKSVDDCIRTFMDDYMSRYYYSVKWSLYNGSNLGNKNIGVNVNYASDPYWGEKAASHMYRIDKALSEGSFREYNNEQLGIYTREDKVETSDGKLVHNILNERKFDSSKAENTAQVGDVVLITGESNGKYEVGPDRAKVLRAATHDWNFRGYIDKESVRLVNNVSNSIKTTTLAGDDRYKTAIAVSQRGWQNGTDNIVLVNSGSIVDALSATPFANSKNAPVLLTQKQTLNSDTEKEIKRLNAKNVYIIGGTSNVSNDIVNKLKSMGLNVERISGNDRYATSLAVAKKLGNVSEVAVVNGVKGLPDAISIAPVAAKNNMPIVLSSPTSGISTFDDYIKNNNIKKSYIIGSTDSVSNSVANKLPNPNRIGGADRNQTNAMIIDKFYTGTNLNNIFVTKNGMKNNDQLIDALAVGVLAAKENSPVVIVSSQLEKTQREVLSSKKASELTQVGAGGNENAFQEIKNLYK